MQASFPDLEYATKKKTTRRDRFLGEINAVAPWSALAAEIQPFYPKGEGRGRPPVGVEHMLRMYIAQQCFGHCRRNHHCSLILNQDGALQGTGEEHSTILHAVWPGESGDSQAEIVCDQHPRCVLRMKK